MTLTEKSQAYYLEEIEKGTHIQDLTIGEGFLGLIAVARQAIRNPENKELFVTECVRCCSDGSSYRLFNQNPLPFFVGRHPDSPSKRDVMLYKCYNEPSGMLERISRAINPAARMITAEAGLLENIRFYQVK